MAANTLHIPEIDQPEGYAAELNTANDGIGAAGFYPQNTTSRDLNVGLERDSSGNLVLKDGITGSKTLAELIGGTSGVSTYDFLLDSEPDAVSNSYLLTRTGGKVSAESWTNVATSKVIKTIDYTRVGGKVNQEVRKVFGPDGATVVAQLTVLYSRAGGRVTGASYTRDI